MERRLGRSREISQQSINSNPSERWWTRSQEWQHGNERSSVSRYTVKIEPTGFTEELGMGREWKKITAMFDLNNYKDGVASS